MMKMTTSVIIISLVSTALFGISVGMITDDIDESIPTGDRDWGYSICDENSPEWIGLKVNDNKYVFEEMKLCHT